MKLKGISDSEKLAMFKENVNSAVKVFVDALPGMKEKMSFKAFTLGEMEKSTAEGLTDLILTQTAIHLKEIVGDKLDKIKFECSTSMEDEKVVIWYHASNEVPEEPTRVELSEEDVHPLTKDDIALMEPSGMGHDEPEKHIRCGATYDV